MFFGVFVVELFEVLVNRCGFLGFFEIFWIRIFECNVVFIKFLKWFLCKLSLRVIVLDDISNLKYNMRFLRFYEIDIVNFILLINILKFR